MRPKPPCRARGSDGVHEVCHLAAGPYGIITLPPGTVDWNRARCDHRPGRSAHPCRTRLGPCRWGFCGTGLSERTMQMSGPAPQYSMANSAPGFGPIGPLLAAPGEFDDADTIELAVPSTANRSRTALPRTWSSSSRDHRASVQDHATASRRRHLHRYPSRGRGRPRASAFLSPGDELVTYMRGVGEMRRRMQAAG